MTGAIVLAVGIAALLTGAFLFGAAALRFTTPYGAHCKPPARQAPRPRTALVTQPAGFPVAGGRHALGAPRLSPSRADLPAHPVPTADSPPWDIPTATIPAVAGDSETDRERYIAAYLREHGTTPETMREAMERAHACGEDPVATVLEAERLAKVMTP